MGYRNWVDNINREHPYPWHNQNGQQKSFAAWGSLAGHFFSLWYGLIFFSRPFCRWLVVDCLHLNSLAAGKIGALLASIPVALAASVLCFTWALIVALGLSTLRYTEAVSSRNMIIVGFTLFISLSIPAYFQQYEPSSNLILPGYLVPYTAASSGPVRTASDGVRFLSEQAG